MPFARAKYPLSANLPTYQPDYCTLDYSSHCTMAGVFHNERISGMSLHSSLLLHDHYSDCLALKSLDRGPLKAGQSRPQKNLLKRTRESSKYVSFDPIPNIIPSSKVKGVKHSNSDDGVPLKHKVSRQ